MFIDFVLVYQKYMCSKLKHLKHHIKKILLALIVCFDFKQLFTGRNLIKPSASKCIRQCSLLNDLCISTVQNQKHYQYQLSSYERTLSSVLLNLLKLNLHDEKIKSDGTDNAVYLDFHDTIEVTAAPWCENQWQSQPCEI